jgi:hypothetical protein
LKLTKVDWLIIGLVIVSAVGYLGLTYLTGYQHTYLLGLTHGEVGADGRVTPLTIDLPLLALSAAKLVVERLKGTVPRWLNIALWFGVVATVAANFYFGWTWGLVGALLAALPACFMALMVETIMLVLRTAAEWKERAEAEAEAKRLADEAERAARQAANSERGKKAAATRAARKSDPGTTEAEGPDEPPVDQWAQEGGGKDPTPTQEVPALTGIGLSTASR